MINIEYEEFTIAVPIERRMTIEQFLAVADRLERISGRVHAPVPMHPAYEADHAPIIPSWQPEPTHAYAAPHAAYDDHESQHVFGHVPAPQVHVHTPAHAAHPAAGDDFRFEHEDSQRLEYFMDRLARQLAKLEETHLRLEKIERTMADHGIQARR